MTSNRLDVRKITFFLIAPLIVAVLASAATAGPISDMLARHRAAKMTKLPPVTKPHTITKIKDPYPTQTAGLSQRFKQRWAVRQQQWALKHGGNSPGHADPGVIKTSN